MNCYINIYMLSRHVFSITIMIMLFFLIGISAFNITMIINRCYFVLTLTQPIPNIIMTIIFGISCTILHNYNCIFSSILIYTIGDLLGLLNINQEIIFIIKTISNIATLIGFIFPYKCNKKLICVGILFSSILIIINLCPTILLNKNHMMSIIMILFIISCNIINGVLLSILIYGDNPHDIILSILYNLYFSCIFMMTQMMTFYEQHWSISCCQSIIWTDYIIISCFNLFVITRVENLTENRQS